MGGGRLQRPTFDSFAGRCAALLGVAWASSAHAQGAPAQAQRPLPSFAIERLELDPAGIGSLALGTGRTLAKDTLRLSGAVHYERNPLVLVQDGVRYGSVIGSRVTVHLGAAWALTDQVELGFALPLVPRQAGDDLSAAGFQNPGRAAAAEPFVKARVALLREGGDVPVDLAAELGLGFPVGSGGALAVNNGVAFVPKLLMSRVFGPVFVSGELGTRLRNKVDLDTSKLGSQLDAGVSAVTDAVRERLRLELTLRGAVPFTNIPTEVEVLAGARYRILPFVEAFVLGGPGARQTPGTPAFRVLAGVAWSRTVDKRALKPPPVPVAVVAPPPAPPPDPCAPGQQHAPAQCPALDDDGDGIPNGADKCPLEKGIAELAGCPALDADGDGVPDYLDNCPNEPGPASNQGCPAKKKQLVIITRRKLEVKEKVFFVSGKAAIDPRSRNLLLQIAAVLRSHAELPPLLVEGHTDNVGKPGVNRKLSQARAEAVRLFLIEQGIDQGRVGAAGFGPDRPMASNRTPSGRASNRRVEFRLDGPELETSATEAESAQPAGPAQPNPPAP
jgi:outer membrane protein OmpA-like peptidoglycan-associated protein